MNKGGLYNRPSIMLSKSKRQVDKNHTYQDKEFQDQQKAMEAKQNRMQAIHEHRRI